MATVWTGLAQRQVGGLGAGAPLGGVVKSIGDRGERKLGDRSNNPFEAYRASGCLLSRRYVEDFFGSERARLLAVQAGLVTPDASMPAKFSPAQFWHLCLDSINRFNDEGQGCTPQSLPKSSWNMVFAAVNQMATVSDGMRRFCELVSVLPCGMTVTIGHGADGAHLNYSMPGAPTRGERYVELMALVFHCVLLWGTDRVIEPLHVRLSDSLSDADGSVLEGLAPERARHGAGVTITYAKDDLALSLGLRRYQSWASHETAIFLGIAARLRWAAADGTSPLIETIRHILDEAPLSQQETAWRLKMSVATLQRRVMHAGTSFRQLSREVRIGKLCSMLATDSSLDDVAADLGFSDRRSLWRACYEWLGMSPSAYRRQHRPCDKLAMR